MTSQNKQKLLLADKIIDQQPMAGFLEQRLKKFFPRLHRPVLSELKIKMIKDFRTSDKRWYVVRYLLKIKHQKGQAAKSLIGALNTRHPKAHAHLILQLLWQNGFARGVCRVPRPLYYSPKNLLQLYEEFPGQLLNQALDANKKLSRFYMASTARWLFKLHQIKLTPKIKKQASTKRLDAYVAKNFQKVKIKLAGETAVIQRLTNIFAFWRCQQKIIKQQPHCLVHGDFNPFNIIINKKIIAALDFEKARLDHPLLDVAALATHLATTREFNLCQSLRQYSKSEIKKLSRVFCQTYFSLGAPPSPTDQFIFLCFEIYYYLQAVLHIILFDWPDYLNKKKLSAIVRRYLAIMENKIKTAELLLPHKSQHTI